MIGPILKEFGNDNVNKVKIVCLALTSAYNSLIQYNSDLIQIKKISDYCNLFINDVSIIKYWGNFVVNTMDKKKIADLEESLLYLGLSMYELVNLHGELKAIELYMKKGRLAFLPEKISKKILEFENPELVFATNSPRMEKSFTLAAISLSIINFQINDLFAAEVLNIVSENIIVMNNFVKNEIEKFKICNIYALGQPALEVSYNTIKAIDQKSLKNRLSIGINKTVVTFFTQQALLKDKNGSIVGIGSNTSMIDIYFYIFEKLTLHPNFEICVRTHPNQDADEYKKLFGLSRHLNQHLTSHESIQLSDIVIVQDSTIGLEALISNKLVFTFDEIGDLSPNYKLPPFHFFSNRYDLLNSILDFEIFKKSKQNTIDFPLNSAFNIKNLLINNL
jgi:hypothetical protein